MAFKQVIEIYEALDSPRASGQQVQTIFASREIPVEVQTIEGQKGKTDFVRILLPGRRGKTQNGAAPTLGIVGRLGGVGARPEVLGLVSDADGAITALATALKLADLAREGEPTEGDVIVATHICPNAPTSPHDPVPFMDAPVDMATMNRFEVSDDMDAVLSIDTTRGNRLINRRGVAITPTVKQGYILKVSPALLDLVSYVTGQLPSVVPITTQDLTPYGNGLDHINSILQPSTATSAPVVGVALTAEVPVPGTATGASQSVDIEMAVRFCTEVAKSFGAGRCAFYDPGEFSRLLDLYGPMTHLQTSGRAGAT
ncbi:MAG: DUF1177 domain-containing protein [Ardenticatenaceae bacterium]|nr:DUF1177 domain-containing protein [Ardenticatenaceae bacterium]HBY94127.1 DUF1177 domain-containing protein [Chloroflexota bacterium]